MVDLSSLKAVMDLKVDKNAAWRMKIVCRSIFSRCLTLGSFLFYMERFMDYLLRDGEYRIPIRLHRLLLCLSGYFFAP